MLQSYNGYKNSLLIYTIKGLHNETWTNFLRNIPYFVVWGGNFFLFFQDITHLMAKTEKINYIKCWQRWKVAGILIH